MPIGKMLTAKDVAETLKVSMSRVRQLVMDSHIVPTQKIGSVNFFDPKNVEEFAKKRRKVGRPKKR